MNHIFTAKTQLKDVLTLAGLKVLDYIPERLTPPVVVISAGAEYLRQANMTNDYVLGLEVNLVATTATNLEAQKALDQLIQDFVNALPGYADLQSVGQPYALSANAAEYLAATATLNLYITLKD